MWKHLSFNSSQVTQPRQSERVSEWVQDSFTPHGVVQSETRTNPKVIVAYDGRRLYLIFQIVSPNPDKTAVIKEPDAQAELLNEVYIKDPNFVTKQDSTIRYRVRIVLEPTQDKQVGFSGQGSNNTGAQSCGTTKIGAPYYIVWTQVTTDKVSGTLDMLAPNAPAK